MRIVRECILNVFRGSGYCGICGMATKYRVAHHLARRGSGRLDILCNLIGLCSDCHNGHHNDDDKKARDKILAIVAKREGCSSEDIQLTIFLLRRLPKNPNKAEIDNGLDELSSSAACLAIKELRFAGIIP